MSPAGSILAQIATQGWRDPVTGRRVAALPDDLQGVLQQAWGGFDPSDPAWSSARFVVGCGLLALGQPEVLVAVLASLPPEPLPARRAFLPALRRLIPFPPGADPASDLASALRWAARATLRFDADLGVYGVVEGPA
ncbi:MAG TPA: hypothetical protein PKA64_20920 [Myxococcota bacterium]|nr:hypothetical protein [Myxococcota bacterium]